MSMSTMKKYAVILAVSFVGIWLSENVDFVRKIVKGA